jgi:acyl carrier protein
MTTNLAQQEEIFAGVCDVLREVLHLGDETITPDDELDLLENADSVRLMQTVSQLERRFDVEVADDAIRDARTVADLTELIAAELAAGGGAS